MKTIILENTTSGIPGTKAHYKIIQDNDMHVIGYEFNIDGKQIQEKYIGECEDIGKREIQGAILAKMKPL